MTPQLDLQFRTSLAERYAIWAQTSDGQEVLRMAEELALSQAKNGATRLSIAWIWESVRRARRKSADNSMRSWVTRRIVELHPELRGLFKTRKLTSA